MHTPSSCAMWHLYCECTIILLFIFQSRELEHPFMWQLAIYVSSLWLTCSYFLSFISFVFSLFLVDE